MAKVEMDLSEFEVLKENKVLLENSLKNERDLREQVSLLNKEKIKALEDARMKVVKIVKSEHKEFHYVKRDSKQFLFDFFRAFGVARHLPEWVLDNPAEVEMMTKRIHDSLFEPVTSITAKFDDEITLEGLDDIKKELRTEIEQTINDDIKTKLAIADEFEGVKKDLLLKISDLNSHNSMLLAQNKSLLSITDQNNEDISVYKEQIKQLNDIVKNESSIKSKIKELVTSSRGLFKEYRLASKLSELLDKKN